MGRYRDILRGEELKKELDKLQTWLGKDRAEKQQEYKRVAKPSAQRVKLDREPVLIKVFNSANGNLLLSGRIPAAGQSGVGSAVVTTLRSVLSGRFIASGGTVGSTDVVVDSVEKYTFASLSLLQYVSTDENSASRITGRLYPKNVFNTVSGNFGRKTDTETYFAAVADIKADNAFTQFDDANDGKNRFSFKPEVG